MKQLFTFLSAAFHALSAVATAHANSSPEEAATPTGGTAPADTAAPAKRGRPAAPKETPAETKPAATEDGAARSAKNRALIEPLINPTDGSQPQGLQVSAIIKKHANGGKLKDIPADAQAAFEADIAALSY